MADQDSLLDDQINEAYSILDQEKKETIEAYRNNNTYYQPVNHLQELLDVMGSLGEEIDQGISDQKRELEVAISMLEDSLDLDRQEDDLSQQLENRWEEFTQAVDEEFERANARKKSFADRATGSITGMIGDSDDDSDDDQDDVVYEPSQLLQELEKIEKKYVNPLVQDVDQDEDIDEKDRFEELAQVLASSIEMHREANKYRLILEKAKQDVDLQQELAESSDVEWFTQEVIRERSQEQRLEREINEIREEERALVYSIDHAKDLLYNLLRLDQDILAQISDEAGSNNQGGVREKIGSLTSGDEPTVLEQLGAIDSVYEGEDYEPVIEILSSNITQKIGKIIRMEQNDIRREHKLAEEAAAHVQEHRSLFQAEQDEVERERNTPTPDGTVDDQRNGAPSRTGDFIEVINELRDLKSQNIIGDLRQAEQNYKKVYRIDHDETETTDDFAGRAEGLAHRLDEVEHDFKNKTPFENAYEAHDGEKLKVKMSKLMNGEPPFDSGLKQVTRLIEKLKGDLRKIYSDEEDLSNGFEQADALLQDEVVKVGEVLNRMDDLESLVEFFRDPERPRNNDGNHPYRAYHDAFLAASKAIYSEVPQREAQERLHNLFQELDNWIQEIDQEIDRIDDVLREVIKEEHVEEEKLEEAVHSLKDALEGLDETFKGDISQPVPSPISQELDQIERAIKEIAERVEADIEPRNEQEDESAESNLDIVEDILDDADTVEEEMDEAVDATDDVIDDFIDDFEDDL